MIKRESSCPLCGAGMTSLQMVDACSALVNAELGVLAARCPHCQGYFELRPATDRIEIGYCTTSTVVRFEVALTLPFGGLVVGRQDDPPGLVLKRLDRRWTFAEQAEGS